MPHADGPDLGGYRPDVQEYECRRFEGKPPPEFAARVFRPLEAAGWNKKQIRHVLSQLLEGDHVLITSDVMRLANKVLRHDGDERLSQHYALILKESERVLRLAGINRHNRKHLLRVSDLGYCMNIIHRVPEDDAVVAHRAARYHDNYAPFLRQFSTEELRQITDKDRVFGAHAAFAWREFEKVMTKSWFRKHIGECSIREAYLSRHTILQHSNGSNGYADLRDKLPLVVKLAARAPDKLDNIDHRVQEGVFHPDSVASTLDRGDRLHKVVPFAIENYALAIDKVPCGAYTVHYSVDLGELESVNGPWQTVDGYIACFRQAYGKSMGRAAEVALTAFASEGIPADPRSFFQVEFSFIDGGKVTRRREAFEPIV